MSIPGEKLPTTKARLSKVVSLHNNLRTDEVIGCFQEWPTIGEPFVFFSDQPIDPRCNLRLITTSEVKDVIVGDEPGIVTITTTYSIYKLDTNI